MPLKIYFGDEPRTILENDELLKKYKRILAGGGLVQNDQGKILLIFRRGKWDLPKGKFEDGESIEQCAEREVTEETGLKTLILQKPLLTSYHTYHERNDLYLKETHWFLFTAPGDQPLAPQTAEDITEITWADPYQLTTYTGNTFPLIKDVLRFAGYTS